MSSRSCRADALAKAGLVPMAGCCSVASASGLSIAFLASLDHISATMALEAPSHMLRAPNNLAPNLCPVDARVHVLVHQAAYHDVVSSDHVQSVRSFYARLWVVGGSNYAFNRVLEYEIGDLVARNEGACEGAAVDSDDDNLFCETQQVSVRKRGVGTQCYAYYSCID